MFKLAVMFFVMLTAIFGVFSQDSDNIQVFGLVGDQGQVIVQLMDDTNNPLMLGPMIEGDDVMLAPLTEPMLTVEGEESNP